MKLNKLALLPLVFVAVIGCKTTNQDSELGSTMSASSIITGAKSNDEASERLALAAEELAYGPAFMYANELADMSLRLNSKNVRARFYSASLAPMMVNKGILKRIQPLVNRLSPSKQKDYKENLANIEEKLVRDFYTQGKEDVFTETKLQNILWYTQNVLQNARHEMGNLENNVIDIHIAPYRSASVEKPCTVTRISEGEYKTTNCVVTHEYISHYNLNTADWTALRLELAVGEIYIGQGTMFDAQGALNVVKRLNFKEDPTDKELIAAINQEPLLGDAIDNQTFEAIREMGPEAAEAFRKAAVDQKTLCKKNYESEHNRPGQLFSHGFCVTRQVMELVPLLESSINKPTVIPFYKNSNTLQPVTRTAVNISAILGKNIKTFKSQLPTTFDSCGNATNIGDRTMGGLFPMGDAVAVINLSSNDSMFPAKNCKNN